MPREILNELGKHDDGSFDTPPLIAYDSTSFGLDQGLNPAQDRLSFNRRQFLTTVTVTTTALLAGCAEGKTGVHLPNAEELTQAYLDLSFPGQNVRLIEGGLLPDLTGSDTHKYQLLLTSFTDKEGISVDKVIIARHTGQIYYAPRLLSETPDADRFDCFKYVADGPNGRFDYAGHCLTTTDGALKYLTPEGEWIKLTGPNSEKIIEYLGKKGLMAPVAPTATSVPTEPAPTDTPEPDLSTSESIFRAAPEINAADYRLPGEIVSKSEVLKGGEEEEAPIYVLYRNPRGEVLFAWDAREGKVSHATYAPGYTQQVSVEGQNVVAKAPDVLITYDPSMTDSTNPSNPAFRGRLNQDFDPAYNERGLAEGTALAIAMRLISATTGVYENPGRGIPTEDLFTKLGIAARYTSDLSDDQREIFAQRVLTWYMEQIARKKAGLSVEIDQFQLIDRNATPISLNDKILHWHLMQSDSFNPRGFYESLNTPTLLQRHKSIEGSRAGSTVTLEVSLDKWDPNYRKGPFCGDLTLLTRLLASPLFTYVTPTPGRTVNGDLSGVIATSGRLCARIDPKYIETFKMGVNNLPGIPVSLSHRDKDDNIVIMTNYTDGVVVLTPLR